jgi:hypothetical protein
MGPLHRASEADPNIDVEGMDAREAARRDDRSLDEQWAMMPQAHAGLVAGASGNARDGLGRRGCPRGRAHEHDDAHTANLLARRDRVGR